MSAARASSGHAYTRRVQDDATHDDSDDARSAIRRELHYFSLYRILEAALLCLVVFSPAGLSWLQAFQEAVTQAQTELQEAVGQQVATVMALGLEAYAA